MVAILTTKHVCSTTAKRNHFYSITGLIELHFVVVLTLQSGGCGYTYHDLGISINALLFQPKFTLHLSSYFDDIQLLFIQIN